MWYPDNTPTLPTPPPPSSTIMAPIISSPSQSSITKTSSKTLVPSLVSALHTPSTRLNTLKLEDTLIKFVKNKKEVSMMIGASFSPFQRLVLHKLCDRLNIERVTPSASMTNHYNYNYNYGDGNAVNLGIRLEKIEKTRVPKKLLIKFSVEEIAKLYKEQQQQQQQQQQNKIDGDCLNIGGGVEVVEPAPTISTTTASTISTTISPTTSTTPTTTPTTTPKIQVMKTLIMKKSENAATDDKSEKTKHKKKRRNTKDKNIENDKGEEEQEMMYAAARLRILGSKDDDDETNKAESSNVSSRSITPPPPSGGVVVGKGKVVWRDREKDQMDGAFVRREFPPQQQQYMQQSSTYPEPMAYFGTPQQNFTEQSQYPPPQQQYQQPQKYP